MARATVAALLLLLITPLASACRTTQAQVKTVEAPALEVPPVPPRVIEPAPVEPPPPDPVPDLPAAPAAPPRQRPPQRDPQREQPKPEAKPDPVPVEPAPPPAPPPATVQPLRTAATADSTQADREVRETLARAQGLLKEVDQSKLNDVRRKSYQEAELFVKQSEAALKESNYVYARKLAEKAETMAKELLGR